LPEQPACSTRATATNQNDSTSLGVTRSIVAPLHAKLRRPTAGRELGLVALPSLREACYPSRVRALVTGATGFVGSALCRRLPQLGFEARALVRRAGASAALEQAAAIVFEGDVGDPNTIADAAADCDVLFHCAGESAYHASADALSWLNVAGTENAILAARRARVKRLVLLSCADVTLWNRDRIHWKENAVLGDAPLGALARSKLLAEELALHASDAKLCVTALRPAWLWGPGDHTNLPGLCAESEHGGVGLFGRGDQLFATTYIDNLVDALCAAARAANVGGHAFHVADSDMLTAGEFFGRLCAAVGLPPPRRGLYALSYATALLRKRLGLDGAWPEDVARRGRGSLLDCLRAIRTLDYQPRVHLDQGLAALSTWAKEQGGPPAIAKLARSMAGAQTVAHHERLARDLS
jgi:nucleoside-diphosphate-sugar epimerase